MKKLGRISEFCGLTVSDIDFDARTINIERQLQKKRDGTLILVSTKTNAGTRVLPMNDDVKNAFMSIVSNRKHLKVEPMVDGRTKVIPHVCRHTYCTNMARSGMNPKTLQYLMGHSDIGITLNTYTHLGLLDAVKEVNRVEKVEKKGKKIVNFWVSYGFKFMTNFMTLDRENKRRFKKI